MYYAFDREDRVLDGFLISGPSCERGPTGLGIICSWRNEMRKLLLAGLLLAGRAIQVGCLVPYYSALKDERARQLIFVSEGLRHIPNIWERVWFLEMPDVITPYRTHGGVI